MGAKPLKAGFHVFVMGWSTAGWNKAKDALDFATLTNDGEGEGAVFLDRLPTMAEAEAIRHWTGLPKNEFLAGRACPSPALRASDPPAYRRRAIKRPRSSEDGQE